MVSEQTLRVIAPMLVTDGAETHGVNVGVDIAQTG